MKESERQISHTKQTQLDQIMNMGSLEECSSNLSSSDSETLFHKATGTVLSYKFIVIA